MSTTTPLTMSYISYENFVNNSNFTLDPITCENDTSLAARLMNAVKKGFTQDVLSGDAVSDFKVKPLGGEKVFWFIKKDFQNGSFETAVVMPTHFFQGTKNN